MAVTGHSQLCVEDMRSEQPCLNGSVLDALIETIIKVKRESNCISSVDNVKLGEIVEAEGAVYSETQSKPKKASVQADHHSRRSTVDKLERSSQEHIVRKWAIVIGALSGNRCREP